MASFDETGIKGEIKTGNPHLIGMINFWVPFVYLPGRSPKEENRKEAINHDMFFFDVKKAAKFLGVKPATIYGWSHRKRILNFPIRKHGSRLVFLPAELKKWSDDQNGILPE